MSVAKLRDARNRPVVAFTEFTRQYKQNESALYCFFEGEDDKKYYGIRIRNIARPIKYSYFSCDGKEGVLDIHRIITNRKSYSQARAAYFIDRDFDVSIKNTAITGIYETPCYSIENLYTSINSFCEILRSEFKLAESDIDFNNCKNLYIKLQKEFHDAVELLNIWIACQREKRADLKLSGFDLSKLVQIDLDNITSNYTINELHTQFPKAITVTQEELDLKQNHLCIQERQKSFRGKFEIYFLFKFIQKLIEEANKGNPKYFTKKIKVTLNLRETTLISDLSQYADTPDCLVGYLESFRTSVN
ncbi:DUF4435 domain-containing protein [Sphaerospermopsis torques-reginae]|jgi:hypothetical protein|uniref:DUF4435 domain-containing protein n=1 Tax=Sphaerospermopsis torques-reginae ITEP-024 TaxID=984208 RepID=A0ABX8WVR8_9CYAN|nr:DUF4435 domain-containing protein [Sphaerospermopsis torques-reginae]QYX30501.1 DUF4435 domain-containing protein [Sphaerospermopsis torques-reginae ITEP-024]